MGTLWDVTRRSGEWLLSHQDAKTGGWSDQPGRPASVLNTAEVLIALLDAGLVPPGDRRIQKAVAWIREHQLREGPDAGGWPREFRGEDGTLHRVPDLVRTCFAIRALLAAGVGTDHDFLAEAVGWVAGARNPDGGWAYARGAPSEPMPTAFAVSALAEACAAGAAACGPPIEFGLAYLVQRCRNPQGSFGPPGPFEAVHTIQAALALQAARRCKLSRYPDEERLAIEWLRAHPDAARRLVEAIVTVDPTGQGNYGYLFVTDSLLTQLLAGSNHREHRRSELAMDALVNLRDKMDEGGGFYGYRVFSWSTAKAVSALSAAAAEHTEFPGRRPEYPGPKVGHFLFGFAVLLAFLVVYLTVVGSFHLLQAAVLTFLMLAALLAYGTIGEKTFRELAASSLGLLGKK